MKLRITENPGPVLGILSTRLEIQGTAMTVLVMSLVYGQHTSLRR